MQPDVNTNTYGRSGFSIYSGLTKGFAGCIDIPWQTGKLSGIFDFDEVAIGTAKFDLREVFFNYNLEIGTAVLNAYNKKVGNPVSLETMKLFLIGWSFVEYMNMKQKITSGELSDVTSADLSEFKEEIKQMIEIY